MEESMRRFLPVTLIALAMASAAPAFAESIVNRPPMDLGVDQTTTLNSIGQDLMDPPHYTKWWFDAGVSYPVGTLQDRNIDPGLLLRVNHQIWKQDIFGVDGSVGVHWNQDSYFNDQQDDIARNAPIAIPGYNYSGVDIKSKYYNMIPVTMHFQVEPQMENLKPFFALGPGLVFTHEAEITSAVNNGVGSVSLGDTIATVTIGPGGEQGISPYAIRTRNRINIGWEAKAGLGFKMSEGEHPLWMRLAVSGTTFYQHTAPRSVLGFVASFGR
jgi:hypothetical protein